MTLREIHGVLQVVMGWEGIHLYQFVIHTARYGSWETGARSPAIALADLKLRKGSRFLYEYDLNIPWEHEVRLEERQPFKPGAYFPACTGGDGTCPQEDCGGPEAWMWRQDNAFGYETMDDLETTTEFLQEAAETKSLAVLDDPDRAEELRGSLERLKERASWLGEHFERRKTNERLQQNEHLNLMHQQM
ncbi:plasmid pRiA4b ORF-3 family protein [Rhizobium sp. 1AS11]|uniref:plasmid pRiA4b ORF-3 family protein n=1 Tax=Rhizobium acaciae TaxID=2989736 RepID=UPI0022223096|nr:plasmid pRiA4b ORF-3 family protein [Rhizobium acaciae]MCW1413727.1 plasmid pRiA4b ORF-3 family protein [Rhizobium acaciae]MCW1746130.1 plasmid pRiA4b ORF-3 family protein [Rhizobium acaciae]